MPTLEIVAASVASILTSILFGLGHFREIALAPASTFAARQALAAFFLKLGLGAPGLVAGYGIGESECVVRRLREAPLCPAFLASFA